MVEEQKEENTFVSGSSLQKSSFLMKTTAVDEDKE